MCNASERRLAENEVIFRQANKDMKGFMQDIGAAGSTTLPFFCECSDTNCRGRIELSAEEYEGLHTSKRRFVILPGHEVPAIEKIVRRAEGFSVVEKTSDLPGDEDVDIALRHLAF